MPVSLRRRAAWSFLFTLLLGLAASRGVARAQCPEAPEPGAPSVPAETTAPALIVVPSTPVAPCAASVAAPIAAPTAAQAAAPSLVVQQSVVVSVALPVPSATVAAPEPAAPPFEPAVAFEYGGFADRAELGGLGFTFDAPDGVPAVVRDLRVDLAGAGDARLTLGGVSFAMSGRPQPWLRGPELRVSLGGADFGGRRFAPAGAPNDVTLALGGVFAFHLEGAFGVQHAFGPLALFALGRVGWGAYFVSARTQEARLGDLGEETLSAHRAEVGTTLGVSVLLGGAWHLEAAWRRTFTGATGDGVLVGMTTELPAAE